VSHNSGLVTHQRRSINPMTCAYHKCVSQKPMEKVGYARVSTTGQSLECQLEQLRSQGCSEIFREKISGAKADRLELHRLLSSLQHGDMLVVTRLDRLARSTADLLQILQTTSQKGGHFLSLAEPWANTSTAMGKLMLAVLGGIAEFERDLIAIRTSEGRERAKRSGVRFGPKPKLSFHQVEEIRCRRELGESCRFLARSYRVSPNTISRIKFSVAGAVRGSAVPSPSLS
jgi:DNA invertase Pin-like site-specific DNA recombinase